MKKINNKGSIKRYLQYLLLFSLMLFLTAPTVNAQKKERTRLKAYYEKMANDQKKISISLTAGRGRNMMNVGNAAVTLFTFEGDSSIEIANLETDENGELILYVEAGYQFPKNDEGISRVEVRYDGNDSLRSSSREVEFADLVLEISTEIVDSVKYLNLTATEMRTDTMMSVQDLRLKVGVKRLTSNLYLGEIKTDEEGKGVFEFPDDIPGDDTGMITLVVKLEDSDRYGTVTKTSEAQWGIPVDYKVSSNGRSLYGDSAPIWMISSVAVILIGAWAHFLWSVLLVFRIKKEA